MAECREKIYDKEYTLETVILGPLREDRSIRRGGGVQKEEKERREGLRGGGLQEATHPPLALITDGHVWSTCWHRIAAAFRQEHRISRK